ncbi:MAG: MBL fold metallo-hydrolase [Negativicutes bacterium]|nr:MBL fold metallo-hydrolase [Negativicutes bacterium]
MKIIALQVGNLGTNCYIAYDERAREAIVVDPGGNAQEIMAEIRRAGLAVKYIVNTHGHADHVLANLKIKEATGALLLIHQDDAGMLTSPHRNLSTFIGGGAVCGPADQMLNDGDVIEAGSMKFTVLHTPGHTPGGICLYCDNVLFSGDTLFAESIGRTDFPGGSYRQLLDSIREKLLVLADEVKVYPGHGPETTIGWERRMNPFIQ